MYARRTAAALAAIGIAASLWAAEPEEKKTPGPEEKKKDAPQPAPELDKLNYFAAAWTSEGTLKPGPGGPGGPTQGRAMCRFMPGKFFMGCMTQSKDPAGTFVEVQSMLGWDAEKKVYRSWTFNSLGRFESATGTLKDDTWTWIGEAREGDKTVHTRSVVSDTQPDSYALNYETSTDGKTWTPVWSARYTKMTPRPGLTPGIRPPMSTRPPMTTPAIAPTPAPK